MMKLEPLNSLLDSFRGPWSGWSSPFERARDREATSLLLVGAAVGALGGLAAFLFDTGMAAVGEVVLGTAFPAHVPPSPWRAVLGTTLAGLAAGLLVRFLTRRGRPQGLADVLARVQLDAPSLSLREGVVSAAAAAIAVGGGFSGGREGPIIQFASAIAMRACRMLGIRPASVRVLVAGGAAAGIAASFNTPLGGAFFALEVLLGNFAVDAFAPVVAATVTGTVVGQALLGDRVALHLPPFLFPDPFELPLYAILGALGALVAHGFKAAVVYGSGRLVSLGGADYLRAPLVGLAIGVIAALGLNEVMGNGYGLMETYLRGEIPPVGFLVGLLVVKVLATSLTVAARTGAGLFAPSLFLGAVTGVTFGYAADVLLPGPIEGVGAFGVVGMAAVAAVVLGAPVTMTLMLFEMTGNYHVILPLMVALAASGLTATALGSRTLEEMELEREGLTLARTRDARVMRELTVADIYREDGYETVLEGAPPEEVVARLLRRRVDEVYVVSADGRYVGSIHLHDVKGGLASPDASDGWGPRRAATARLDECIADVLGRFFDAPGDGLPVVDDAGRLRGVLLERDVVAAYHREVLRKDARLAHVVSRDEGGEHDDYIELPEGQSMEVVPVGDRWAGARLCDLGLPSRHGCTVVAMKIWDPQRGDWRREPVDAARPLAPEDELVVIGPSASVRALVEATPPPDPGGAP